MSSSGRIALAAAAVAAALLMSGCADATNGLAEPDRVRSTEVAQEPAPSDVPASSRDSADRTVVAGTGECLGEDGPGPVDCSEPHTVEVTAEGTFGGDLGSAGDGAGPDRDTVFRTAFPQCRRAAAEYLGSDAYDASTLGAWLVWADDEDWESGDRWYRCGVAELDGDGQAQTRTGSVRGALADDFERHRVCSSTRPSEQTPAAVECDGPHMAEAVDVVSAGSADKAMPPERKLNALARDACGTKVRGYVGGKRHDVAPSWRWPDEANWRNGYTNITCYAEFRQSTSGSVRGIGSSPLPK